MVGVVLVLFAVGRMLTPFSTRVVLNPQALRAATRVEPCGMALSEATKAPNLRHDEIVLTPSGQRQKDLTAAREYASPVPMSAIDFNATNALDALYDHTTVSTFTLSPCESAARRRVTSAGVLIGLAVVGVVAALLLLRDRQYRTDPLL